MKIYRKFVNVAVKVLSGLAIATIVAMLILMTLEVIRRYIFGVTFSWSDEVIRLLLVFSAYFGGAVAYHNKGMVCFDLVTSKVPEKVRYIFELFNNIVVNVFLVFCLYVVFLKMTSPAVVKSISTATGLSGAVPYYGIFIGLIFLTLFTVDFYPEMIRNAVSGWRKGEDA